MAAKNIINVLRGRLRQQIGNLYAKQNKKNAQYLVYDIKHMRVLIRNAITTFINTDRRFSGVTIDNLDKHIDREYRKYVTKSTIQKIYTQFGFKFIPYHQRSSVQKGKIAYFNPTVSGDMIKLHFPLYESRAHRHMSKYQKRQPLPNVYDSKVTFKGPNQKIIGQLFINVLISALKLKTKRRGRGISMTAPDGTQIAPSSLSPVIGMKNAVKLHGGDKPKQKRGQTPPDNLHIRDESTTAYLVDLVEQLQSGSLQDISEKTSGKVVDKAKFEEGFDALLEAFDAHFTINNTTVSDIVKNNKKIEIGLVIGDKSKQKLMEKADKQGLKQLLGDIEVALTTYFSTNPDALASKSMKDLNTERGAQAIIKGIFGPLTQSGTPDMRFKANKALMNKKRGKKQTTAQFKESFAKMVQTGIISKASATPVSRKSKRYDKNTTNSTTSLASLMQIVNAELPRFLKRNMTPPRLQYRGKGNPSKPFAGPFNTGVEVTSLTDSKSNIGGLNVNYTYEKYPYQTFEPGFEQGSTLRDPRELIKESIRQIMIQNKQNRFLRFRRH